MKNEPTLTTIDLTEDFKKLVTSFRNDAVLVGIPEEETDRKSVEGEEPITNAAILAINEFGSEDAGIPPRPVMAIGIKNCQEEVAEQLKLAVVNSFSQGMEALYKYYNRAGIIASQSIKNVINNQIGIDEPSEATLEARLRAGFKGTKALIVTGQLRNAITYVVNKRGT